jgi:hypothetical protein
MKPNLQDRLNEILPRLQDKDVLSGAGLGNEIGFYIFDYPPENELEVREHLRFVLDFLTKMRPDIKIAHVNLFELIVGYLKERNLLDRALKLQREKGDAELYNALKGPLQEEKIAKALITAADPQAHDMILLSGIGSAWPLIRSHTLLNALHPLMGGKPLVVFYPGSYDGKGLRLFNRLSDRNYYRAFRLVP